MTAPSTPATRWTTRQAPAPCTCGADYEQTFLAGRWVPDRCPACVRREDERRAAAEREAAAAAAQERRLVELQIPPLYQGATLDTFETRGERALQRIRHLAGQYVEDWTDRSRATAVFPQVVVFRGGPGTGKGHVAWSIARAVTLQHGARARVAKLGDIVRDLRESWGGQRLGESEATRLLRYRTPDLLVIDEVSRHALSNRDLAAVLYDLVDARQEWLRPTILTTNEPDATLAELLGPALVSRVKAWSGIWEFGAVDYRATVLAPARRAARAGWSGTPSTAPREL